MSQKTILETTTPKTVLESEVRAADGFTLQSFEGYAIIKEFEAVGAEADIYLINYEEQEAFLKLYRRGVKVHQEILESVKELSNNYKYFAKVFEYGYDEKLSRYYEVSEYIENGDLTKLSKDDIDIKSFIAQLNEALELIHSKNIIHRDLKPTNILIKINFTIASSTYRLWCIFCCRREHE